MQGFDSNATFWLLAGLIGMYIAGRAMLDALVKPATSSSMRLGWTMATAVACVTFLAVLMDRPAVAVALLFAVSVASLSLVTGTSAVMTPVPALPPVARRVWVFLLPIAVLTLLAGFSAKLTLTHAAILAMQGALVLFVRTDPRNSTDEDWAVPVLQFDHTVQPRTHQPLWWRLELVLSILLLLISGYLVIDAARVPSSPVAYFPDTLLAVAILSPMLLLPMLGIAGMFAQRGRGRVIPGAAVTMTILCLCVVLPLAVCLWTVRPTLLRLAGWAIPGLASADPAAIAVASPLNPPMTFPMPVWRVDTIVLLILSLAALPVALGRCSVGRREGVALIVLYALYLMANALLATRY